MEGNGNTPPTRTARLARLAVTGAATISGAILLGVVLTLSTGPLLAVAAGLLVLVAGLILGLPLLDGLAAPAPHRQATAPAVRGHQPHLVSRH